MNSTNLVEKGSPVIGILAPSAPSEASRLAKGLKYIESLGWRTKVMLDPSSAYGTDKFLFSSDTPLNRAQAIKALLEDDEVGVIWCTRGAYGSMEILPYLPVEEIKRYRKPIVGFSDVTALLIAFDNLGVPAIHGTSIEYGAANAVNNTEHERSVSEILSFLSSSQLASTATTDLSFICGSSTKASLKGSIVGGNLSLLSSLMGTPWEFRAEGKFLFFEEVGESPYRIHRMLLQMKLGGKLKNLQGVLIGHLTNCVHSKGLGPNLEQALVDIFKDASYPVFKGVKSGHEPLNLPIFLGHSVTLEDEKLRYN
mgnify:CR=1 FL=1